MSDITVFGNEVYSNEDAKFFKDVYIYGKLYYDFESKSTLEKFGDIEVDGTATFNGPVFFNSDVTLSALQVGILTVTQRLDVGVNGETVRADATTGNVGVGSNIPQQKLDIGGSVKIDSQIYDATNNPGVIGAFLTKDAQGIKWVEFEPSFTEGIFVYNESVLVGPGSYRGLNLKTGRGAGVSTDPIQGTTNPSNPNIADITVTDYWDYTEGTTSIYRNSNVGINNSNPSYSLDVTGTVNITSTLNVNGTVTFNSTLDVDGATTLNNTLDVDGGTTLNSTLDVDGATTLNSTLDVDGGTTLNSTLDVDGSTTLNLSLDVDGATTLNDTLDVDGATTLNDTLDVDGATTLNATLSVGVGGAVIKTTETGSIGFGSITPTREVDFQKDVRFQQAIYDANNNVGYKSEYYQVPRNVLTTVGVDTTGSIIGGRFFDAANLIRLNLDFIASEAIGFLTSTSYKNPPFQVVTAGGATTDPSNCRDDIKDILKAITYDITRGGNSRSVGAGLSYYTSGGALQHITGTDPNGYSVKEATIVAITTAAQVARYVINNLPPPISYQGIGSISLVRDLTLQDDPNVGSNIDPDGCANVVSAITVCAGIVTTIIGGGPSASPNVTTPDGKIVWAPAGADSRNLIWVSKYGNDDNTGSTEGDAKLTIAAAAEIAQPGDTIMVRSGVYYENNPIGLRTDVSVSGQDLRLVTLVPKNLNKDFFHLRRGCLVENLNFACESGQINIGAAIAFPPSITDVNAGISHRAVSGYTEYGPATEGPTGRWRSPYIRNCTNFMPRSIGMKINGDHATAGTIGNDLKCMVCDSFTQYNENGIGVSITNNGYAQLVSIFTINCDIAIYAASGGSCDLTNSNSSFGNYGLVAVGLGSTEFTGKVNADTTAGLDTVVLKELYDNSGIARRPYDGQALWFKIDLDNYPDAVGTGQIVAPLTELSSITVVNGGSGFSATSPPNVVIRDNDGTVQPKGPQGIIAEASATVDENGQITAIDVISSGRNYLSTQNIVVDVDGDTSLATAVMSPIYYTVSIATVPTPSPTGITTVTFNEFIPYELFEDDSIELRRISRILTSGHSFEYIGTGTDINTSTPLKGAVPIKANEVVAIDGALIPFTSTDQKGNFDIGEGIQIDQTTSTIRGRDFSRAIQAEVTPLILALR